MPRFFLRLLALMLLAIPPLSVSAENLVTIKNSSLPNFPGTPEFLFVVSGQPVVVQQNRLWRLDEARKDWRPTVWQPPGKIHGVIVQGQRPYLMIETTPGQGVDRVEPYPEAVSATPVAARLPSLPVPLARARGAALGGTLYVIGTAADGKQFWMSTVPGAPAPLWNHLPPWPDMPTNITSLVTQDASILLTATASRQSKQEGKGKDKGDQFWRWTPTSGWSPLVALPGAVVEGAARAIGQAHLLYLVRTRAETEPPEMRLITYHTITNAFSTQGEKIVGDALRGTGVGNGIAWEVSAQSPAGEARDAAFHIAEIEEGKLLLRPLDWAMIVLYLIAIAGIGAYCYWREEKQSTSEFFVGNRTIPFWAAAVSLYVTSTSSIGYIATTAKAFATNWQYLVGNIVGVLGLFFVAIWIVPMLRRLKLVSVFDYLEQRFHPSVRMMASAMCIVLHLGGRMSIILFLPSLAIATITGFDMVWSILIMGLVTIGYTALGGMRAVIWTDFLQLFVKVGGLVFALIFIWYKLDGSPAELYAAADTAGKVKMLDWSFDVTKATVWGFIFVVLMETVLTFPKDQVLMQRVFTTKSDKEAGQSVWLFAAIIIPAAWLFYLIGTGLWTFYQSHPERMNPLLSVDATFPLFIAAELPAGVTGLMIAGIFAASMATCSSIMNSVATMVSVDFYERLAKNPTQRVSIRLAEIVTVIAGMIGIGLALLLSRYNIGSYLDVALELYGLLGGGFGGAYTLGMFTRRANWQGVLIGMVASMVLTFAAWWFSLVHPFIYLGIAILFSIVFGYIGSLFFPPPAPESLEGLIIQR